MTMQQISDGSKSNPGHYNIPIDDQQMTGNLAAVNPLPQSGYLMELSASKYTQYYYCFKVINNVFN